jgi:hypothetical protein
MIRQVLFSDTEYYLMVLSSSELSMMLVLQQARGSVHQPASRKSFAKLPLEALQKTLDLSRHESNQTG